MDNSKQSKQILLSVIGVAILVVAVVGVSFAFFNYTRTGQQNTLSTGKIKFTSTQTGDGVSLTNKFPVTTATYTSQKNQTYDSTTMDFAQVVVTIAGETTYSQGLDFRVTARNVNFTATVGNDSVSLPVNVDVIATQTTASPLTNDSITAHPSTSGAAVPEGYVLADGHIDANASNASWNNGTRYGATVTVNAYLDASKIAITDTSTDENDPHIDNGTTNGTTSDWILGRTVITTDQWNQLSASSANNLSFKIRVESKEAGTGRYVDNNGS